jgi:hypothetical protein
MVQRVPFEISRVLGFEHDRRTVNFRAGFGGNERSLDPGTVLHELPLLLIIDSRRTGLDRSARRAEYFSEQ